MFVEAALQNVRADSSAKRRMPKHAVVFLDVERDSSTDRAIALTDQQAQPFRQPLVTYDVTHNCVR